MVHRHVIDTEALARTPKTANVLLGLGVLLILIGTYIGIFIAPAEVFMGEVYRILYVHVPTAWNALLALTLAFAASPDPL